MKKISLNVLMFCLIGIAITILGALYIWAPVCPGLLELANGNMVHMKCFYTSQTASVLAILLLVLAISSIATKRTNSLMIIALGIMLIAITYQSVIGIGICMKETMECHQTAPWLRYGGMLIIVLGIASAFKKKDFTSLHNDAG